MKGYVTLPVDLAVNRNYRIYVNVPEGAGQNTVQAAVLRYIQNNGLDDSDLSLELSEVEEADINGFVPDWDGAWTSDEGGIE